MRRWDVSTECSPYLKVCVFIIKGDVDGEGGGVVMGPQVCLSLRRVFYYKVHYSITLCPNWRNTSSELTVNMQADGKPVSHEKKEAIWAKTSGPWLCSVSMRSHSPWCSNQRKLLKWRAIWTLGWSEATLCQSQFASYGCHLSALSRSRQRFACPEREVRKMLLQCD